MHVTLVSEEGHGSWSCFGITDANGIAAIRTTCNICSDDGAALGMQRILLLKPLPRIIDTTPQERLDKMDYNERAAHDNRLALQESRRPPLLPVVLNDLGNTPLRIEVKPDQRNGMTIEVSEYR